MKTALKVSNLKKTYVSKFFNKTKKLSALKGISFSVKKGEIFGVLGPNGAGKSTAINIIADLLTCDSGSVTVFGKDFFKHTNQLKQDMALINGYATAPHNLTIYENMKIYAIVYNVKNFDKRIDELLKLVNLSHIKHKRFSRLSTGQKTRVNIVKGFLHKPKLILMDEPTIGLDPLIAHIVRDMIRKINEKEKVTIIFTSHNMNEVESLCHRVALLKNGEILKTATVKELKTLIDVQTHFMNFKGSSYNLRRILKKYKCRNIKVNKNFASFDTGQSFVLAPLLQDIVQSNIRIQAHESRRTSLEDIFINIAEGKL
jgi:ABC-2 type transport system ATP-binding protein